MQFSEEKAIVSHIEDEFVFLETQNTASCSNCSAKSGCGKISSIFTFKPKSKLRVYNSLKLNVGDSVVIGLASDKLLKASVLMYLSPLLLFFLFTVLTKLFIGETASIIAGLIGLLSGLLLVKLYTQQKLVAKYFEPQLIRKVINIDIV